MKEVDITEFVDIDPDSVHAVFKAANGTDFLMIKQVDDEEEYEGKKLDGDADDKAEKAEFCGDPTCEICISRAAKGKLSMEERRQIPKSDFALPEKAPGSGSYPIKDKAHARAALRMRGHASPEDQARIKRAVASKYPDLGKGKKKSKKAMAGQQEVESSAHGSTPSPSAQMAQTKGNQRGQKTTTDVTSDRPSGQATKLGAAGSRAKDGTGFGDTAPDKDIHKDEASGETDARVADEKARQNASKEATSPIEGAGVDMKGDTIPSSPDEGTEAGGRAQAQTEANMRANQPTGSDAIRDQMTRQGAQAQKAFKFKVKKGGKKKKKKNAPLEISGAMKQKRPERVLSEALASKEFDDMNGAELAEVMTKALADDRAARKAERKAKKERKDKKAKKAERKAAKAKATAAGGEEAAQEAAKSISPEKLVEGVGARVQEALKESLKPLFDKMTNLENQPPRPRLAINGLAGREPVMRDQRTSNGGSGVMDVLKPLEDAFKSEKDPHKKEKLGGELTKAKLVIRERLAHGQAVSQDDAAAIAAISK